MSPRAFGLALLLALPAALCGDPSAPLEGPRPAAAAVSILLSLDEMVALSSHVVVATAVEKRSQWEDLGGARRIVTYTKLSVERTVAGDPAKEVWVRTLGGVVGRVGQHVAGDARLVIGEKALLFLAKARDGALVVTAMAQGHFPLVVSPDAAGDTRPRLAPSPDTGALLPQPGPRISAREVLLGAALDTAVETITRAWNARDAKK